FVSHTRLQEAEINRNLSRVFIIGRSYKPVSGVSFLPCDRHKVTWLSRQYFALLPVHTYVLDELESRISLIIFHKITCHLDGAVDHHIQGQLLSKRSIDLVVRLSRKGDVKYTGRKIKRPGQHPSKGNDADVLGRVSTV